jgi:hypothetical protein
MEKKCTHPAICNGVCLVCHEKIQGKEIEIPVEQKEEPVPEKKPTRRKTK